MSAIYDTALEPLGVNIAQYFLLRTLGDHQPLSLTELGRHVELDRSTIGRNARVLERLGFVSSGRGDNDQREAQVSLTGLGAALVQQALPVWEECQQGLVSRLGADKVEALSALLSMA